MATLDIIIIGLITLSAVLGLNRGFVREAASLFAWVGAFAAALFFGPMLASTFPDSWSDSPIGQVAAFLIMLAIGLVLGVNLQWMLVKVVKSTGLTGTDRTLGVVFGAFRGAIVATIVLMCLQGIADGASWWDESELKDTFLDFEDEIWGGLDVANETMRDLRDMGEETGAPDVPDVPDLPDDSDLEYEDYDY
jgi:membrane protein required for colicin V production